MRIRGFLEKAIFLLIVTSIAASFLQPSQGTYVKTKRIGGAVTDHCDAITTDLSGNVYVTGDFSGSVIFGADFGNSEAKISAGGKDVFVTRINANGTYGWTRRMGGDLDDEGSGIISDPSGNVYVTGYFYDTVDFGADFGTSDIKEAEGNHDVFITRINPNGTYGWTRRIGGTSYDQANGISTDTLGNIYITGYFREIVDFGADFGTSDIKSSVAERDIFISKIRANGTYEWTRRMGGDLDDEGSDVISDPSGNVYIVGAFQDTVNFGADFGTTDTKTSAGDYDKDIFITRINSSGSYGWTRRMGGTSYDRGWGITSDPSGNVYVTGDFGDTVNFGADFATSDIKTSAGDYDIFVTRINSSGSYGWTRRMGGISYDHGYAITSDPSGNVYVTGDFRGTVIFGADFGRKAGKTSAGDLDIFVTRISGDTTYGWTRRMGGTFFDHGWDITSDPSGNVYVAGDFYDTVDFGADFGTTDIYVAGSTDIFITKLKLLSPVFDGHDFNGDGSSDASVWRPSNGRWYIKGVAGTVWGQSNDIPANGDYNGDGKTDIAVWRPTNGRWYIKGGTGSVWGKADDIPVPGNYNGDIPGTTDLAVWRTTNGRWYIKGVSGAVWGIAGDIPVPGNYDGDGDTDLAVWRPSNGRWYIKGLSGAVWGIAGDIPVPGDYDGDGDTDLAVWRPSNGRWYIKGMAGAVWGIAGDIPVPGDYNGNGKTDMAVWRPSNGRWYIKDIGSDLWGILGDIPLVR